MKFDHVRLVVITAILLFSFSCKSDKKKPTIPDAPAFRDPAVKAISLKIADNPTDARLYYNRGVLLHRMQEDSLALNDFEKAVNLDSSRAEYFSAVGDLMFEHKDVEASVPWIQKAVELNPNDPTARLKIAKMFVFIKEYPKAFTEINTVLRANAMVPEAYFLKGLIYDDLKDTAKAISSFQTALQVDPSYGDAMIQLGGVYSRLKDPIALKYYDNAFKLDSTKVFPLYARGMFYQEQKKFEEAKEEYRNAIVHDRDYADAYFAMGYILLQQDSLDKAWRQFDLVTKLEPTNEKAYYNRGLASEMMGKNKEALQDYQQALTFNPQYQEAAAGVKRVGKGGS
jgi:tetratricopeptide (TPR) repeat protein